MESERLWQLLAGKWLGEATKEELEELDDLLKLLPGEYEKEALLDQFFRQQQVKSEQRGKAADAWVKHFKRMEKEFPDDFASPGTGEKNMNNTSKRVWLTGWRKWAVAASVVLIATVALLITSTNRKQDLSVKETKALSNMLTAAKGDKIKSTLPDGTLVWLNGNSRIEYNANFGREKREIVLTGEAFFDVAHNAAVPLIVHAKGINITVKGTAFNVKAYPEDSKIEASLIRGSIELTLKKAPGKKILLHPNEKITVLNDEPLAARRSNVADNNDGNVYQLEELKPEEQSKLIPEISWVQNKLVFNNEKFEDMIPTLEKWYDVKITVNDEELSQQQFSAVFEKETLEEVLYALHFTYNFRYELKDKQVYIYKN